MALKDPAKKMSKSDKNTKNTIFLLEDPAAAKKKILQSLTDNENKVYYDLENKPGVSNLMNIMASVDDISLQEITDKYKDLGYREFKNDLGDIIAKLLTKIQTQYNQIINSQKLDKILEQGANEARIVADKQMAIVKEAVGLTYKQKNA